MSIGPRASVVCPPVAAYNRAFQARLADEIQRLPPGAALERAVLDYARLCDQAQACVGRPEIVEILNALDRKIDLHRRKRALLEALFKSLLHKLMTGEIRVADLDLSALEAADESIGANGAPTAMMRATETMRPPRRTFR